MVVHCQGSRDDYGTRRVQSRVSGEIFAEKKKLLLSIESWLVDRNPFHGLLNNWLAKSPSLYTLNNQVFFIAQMMLLENFWGNPENHLEPIGK